MEKEKIKVALIGIVLTFVIFAVGWGVLSFVIGSVSVTNQQSMINTTGTVNSVTNIGGMFIAIIAIITILLVMGYFASSFSRYQKLGKMFRFLVDTAYYFAFGLLAVVVVVIPAYSLYLLYNYAVLDGHAGDVFPVLQWVGVAVGAFFGIAAVGYGFKKKIIDKYVKYKVQIKGEIKKEKVKA